MSSDSALNKGLSKKSGLFGLKVWVIIGIGVMVLILCILCMLFVLVIWSKSRGRRGLPLTYPSLKSRQFRRKLRRLGWNKSHIMTLWHVMGSFLQFMTKPAKVTRIRSCFTWNWANQGKEMQWSFWLLPSYIDRDASLESGEEGSSGTFGVHRPSSSYPITAPSPLVGLADFSHLGWGHWFTLRDLELATDCFSNDNVLGEGGYGVVYRGNLSNGTPVAVKKLLNNLGQAEKEFRVEVEAIGHVRHKNLVRLLDTVWRVLKRMLVYEYVNNGNLEQWLHGALCQRGFRTREARIKFSLKLLKRWPTYMKPLSQKLCIGTSNRVIY